MFEFQNQSCTSVADYVTLQPGWRRRVTIEGPKRSPHHLWITQKYPSVRASSTSLPIPLILPKHAQPCPCTGLITKHECTWSYTYLCVYITRWRVTPCGQRPCLPHGVCLIKAELNPLGFRGRVSRRPYCIVYYHTSQAEHLLLSLKVCVCLRC